MNKYMLGIKFKGCSKDIQKTCVTRFMHGKCDTERRTCFYPIHQNPLCLCTNVTNCPRAFTIIKDKKSTYVLYNCHKRCKFLVTDYKNVIKNYIKPFGYNNVYYGENLDKLVKRITKGGDSITSNEKFNNFMEYSFKNLDFRMG